MQVIQISLIIHKFYGLCIQSSFSSYGLKTFLVIELANTIIALYISGALFLAMFP